MAQENTGRTTTTFFKQTNRKNKKLSSCAMTPAKAPKQPLFSCVRMCLRMLN